MTDFATNRDDEAQVEEAAPLEDGAPADAGEVEGVTEPSEDGGPGDRAADDVDGAVEASDAEGPEDAEDAEDAESERDLRAALELANDRHLRLAAEFNNYRRRVEQERVDTWGRAQADLLGRLLDVLDDLQRVAGLDLTNTTVDGIMEGIDLVERKFLRALEDAGAEIIDPEGESFDPQTMEAMMRVPAESEDDDDRVAQVFQKGYSLKGHLVRVARVSVLKHG